MGTSILKKMATTLGGGILALSAATAATSAVAEEQVGPSVSANVALTSDYRFRGISQSDGPAIQGGFDVDFGNGFYAGTWGSSVDFAHSLELDYYAGYTGSLSEALSYDLGFIYYDYPNTEGDDPYAEVYGSLSYADATVGLAYSNDYYYETGTFYYLYGDYSYPLGSASLDFHLGLNSFDTEEFIGTDDSYMDYSVGVSWGLKPVDLSLSVVSTDLSDEPVCGEDLCDTTVVLALSKSL